MRFFGREISGIAKTIVVFAVVFLVASGLCGLQLALANYQEPGNLFFITGLLELCAMVVSAGGIVVMSLVWVIHALQNKYDPEPGTKRLLDYDDPPSQQPSPPDQEKD